MPDLASQPFNNIEETATAWIRYFNDKLVDSNHLNPFHSFHPTHHHAQVISVCWHSLSQYIPWFLYQATARVQNKEFCHSMIRSAYEELGLCNYQNVHSDLFFDACKPLAISQDLQETVLAGREIEQCLRFLTQLLNNTKADQEVLGLFFCLIMAEKANLEFMLKVLDSQPLVHDLKKHSYFMSHQNNYTGFLDFSIELFMTSCQDVADKEFYIRGFEQGLQFWNEFWSASHKLTNA